MKSITLNEPGRLSLNETTFSSQPSGNYATVRVRRVGICGTDLHAFKGEQPFFTYPRVLGHELGVEVVSVGKNAAGLRVGDRCAVEPYLHCGVCIACRRGKTNCCERIQVLGVQVDGGMQELIAVPSENLHQSESLSLDELSLVEPLSIGAHAVSRAHLEPGEFVVVIGAGPIGLAVIQFAQLEGARVIALDVIEERLAFARTRFQVEAAIAAGEEAVEQVRAITGGDLPTTVFDATGSLRSMTASFDLPAHGGHLVLVGFCHGEISFRDQEAHRRELTVACSRNATASDFKRVIGLLESGAVDVAPWITHRVSFGEEVIEQFPVWLEPESRFIKAVIEI